MPNPFLTPTESFYGVPKHPRLVRPLSGGPSPVPTLPYDPSAAFSLAFWYDPSDSSTFTLSGSDFTQVNDKSGNGRHLTVSAGKTAPSSGTKTIGSLNCMEFDGINDSLNSAAITQAQPVTLLVVLQLNGAQGGQPIGYSNLGNPIFWHNSGTWGYYAGGTFRSLGATPDTNAHILAARFDNAGGTSAGWFDGSQVSTSDSGTDSWLASDVDRIWIGNSQPGSPTWGGIGEVIGVVGAPSNAQLDPLIGYLGGKWGVSVPQAAPSGKGITVTAFWDMPAQVSAAPVSLKWDTAAAVSQTSTLKWDLGGFVSQTYSLKWDLYTTVTGTPLQPANPGFEVNAANYITGGTGYLNSGAALTRITSDKRTGTGSGQLVSPGSAAFQGFISDPLGPSGSFVIGQPVTAHFWLKSISGATAVNIFMGPSAAGHWDEASITLTGAFAEYTVTWTPTIGFGTDGIVGLRVPAASAATILIDDISITGVAPQQPYSLLWDLPSSVAQSRSLLWDMAAQVTQSRTLLWDLIAQVSQARSLKWDLFSAVSQAETLKWDLLAAVAQSRTLLWDLSAAVSQTRTLLWDLIAQVSQTRVLKWDLFTSVAQTRTLLWDLIAQVSQIRSLKWDLFSTINATASSLKWDLFSSVSASLSLIWDLIVAAAAVNANALSLKWDMVAQVAQSRTVLWDLIAQVAQTRTLLWDTFTTVNASVRVLLWDLIAQVSQSRVLKWDAFTTVNANVSRLLWDLSSAVAQTRSLIWDTNALVNATARTLLYDLAAAVSQTRILKFDLFAAVSLARSLLWDMSGAMSASVSRLVWDLFAAAAGPVNSIPLKLLLDLYSQVSAAESMKWDIYNTVSPASNTYKWDLFAAASQSRALKWDLFASVTQSRILLWDLIARVNANPDTLKWDTLASVNAVQRALLWDLYGALSASPRSLLWDTRSQANGLSRVLRWDLFIQAQQARSLRWDLTVPVSPASLLGVWDLYSLVAPSPRAFVWDTRAQADAIALTLIYELISLINPVDGLALTLLWTLANPQYVWSVSDEGLILAQSKVTGRYLSEVTDQAVITAQAGDEPSTDSVISDEELVLS